MAHRYETAVICCVDPRFFPGTLAWLKKKFGLVASHFDLISWPGAIVDLARPKSKAHQQLFLNKLKLLAAGHGTKRLILINHSDTCAGYRGQGVVLENRKEEQVCYRHDFAFVKRLIKRALPSLRLETYVAELRNGKNPAFVKIK